MGKSSGLKRYLPVWPSITKGGDAWLGGNYLDIKDIGKLGPTKPLMILEVTYDADFKEASVRVIGKSKDF